MFERSLPDKLSVVCRSYVGVVSVLLGSIRGSVGLNSATDGKWSVGLRYMLCIGHMSVDLTTIQGRFKTESSPTKHRIAWSRPTIPKSQLTSARHISNPNRMLTDNRLWRHTYIQKHTKSSGKYLFTKVMP